MQSSQLGRFAGVAMFATMLRRDRERDGLRVARASRLIGVTVREFA